MNPLIQLFNSILPISATEQQLLEDHLISENYTKGTAHCAFGTICKKLSYIEEGIFKVAGNTTNDEEFIKYFACKGHFAVDLDSFFHQTPSEEDIISLTPCKVITITPSSFTLFEEKITNFSKIINLLKEKALLEKYKVKSEMLVDNAETRYTKFLQRYPEIALQIPQNLIALHLGISQFTLSRIRTKATSATK